jgi:transcriptional regulator GlxA family with amidase domain
MVQLSILLFDGVDLLDAGGPYEVALTANRLAERDGATPPFRVDTVTVDGAPVTAYGGLGLVPTTGPEVLGATDVLVVPGAIDLSGPLADDALRDAIIAVAERDTATVASVCTGAFLLDGAGLLAARAWTTHWEDVDLLAERTGRAGARRGVRWVDSGTVVTAGGLSSGIAMALHLVERFAGRDLAERTAEQIDYVWSERSDAGPGRAPGDGAAQ